MGPHLKLEGVRDGKVVQLPLDLDAITIATDKGMIYLDLCEQVENMVLMLATQDTRTSDLMRLILSPMESGRLAVGVIRTSS